MAQNSDWSALISRAATHPHEAIWSDRCGNTALHLACRKKPNKNVILSLIRACHTTLSMKTVDGMTPLHFAAYCGASYDVVKILVNANRQVVSYSDRRGRTPLQCACIGRKTSDTNNIIKELLQISPDLCSYVDNNGRSPLFLVLDDYADAIEEQMHIMTRNTNPDENQLNTMDELSNKITADQLYDLDERWVTVTLLLKAAYKETAYGSTPNTLPFRLVHACIGAHICPMRFIFLVLNLWPEQLKQKDSDGNLPLHIAAFSKSKRKHCRFNTLTKVLSMCPEAARIPDQNGALPLKLALQSRKGWNDGVKELFEAYPEALATLDMEFQYYPEITALAGKSYSLNTLYQIISSKPEVLTY